MYSYATYSHANTFVCEYVSDVSSLWTHICTYVHTVYTYTYILYLCRYYVCVCMYVCAALISIGKYVVYVSMLILYVLYVHSLLVVE